MMNNFMTLLKMLGAVAPFVVLCLADVKTNLHKSIRSRQFLMPVIALIYSVIAVILSNTVCELLLKLIEKLPVWIGKIYEPLGNIVGQILGSINWTYGIFILANIAIITVYLIVKKSALGIIGAYFNKNNVSDRDVVDSFMNSDSAAEFAKNQGSTLHSKIASKFYSYDVGTNLWFIKPELALARKYLATIFYTALGVSTVVLILCRYFMEEDLIEKPFYPVFGIIILGELFFYIQGMTRAEHRQDISGTDEESEKIVNYTLLRARLRDLFGDRTAAEDTTVNNALVAIRTNDEVIDSLLLDESDNGAIEALGHFVKNYFHPDNERELDQNYVYAAKDMLEGKSIVFNNPFYNDLIPYAFFPMHYGLMNNKKVLVVLGRHAIEEDIKQWITDGLAAVNNIPSLWRVGQLTSEASDLDVGIITRSDVHNAALHEANMDFFSKVGFMVIIEPSKLLTTAQIGLNLIVKRCKADDKNIVFCSIDKNCDGLVDSLSHVLMTSLTEVSATNKHLGVNSYMCWDTDSEYLHHRLLPNISRYMGFGTELSFVALKNQVSSTCWYGGEAYPVTDQQWIARQYYYDLLKYAGLPTKQDMLDEYFRTSANFWSAKCEKNSYMTVEDESFNMFEVVRNFSTRADEQGFVNVISSEYMLKDYMSENNSIFEADAKAIPCFVADYVRTPRNVVLRLILMLSTGWLDSEYLKKELSLIGHANGDPRKQLWKEIIDCYTTSDYSPSVEEAYTQKLQLNLEDGSVYNAGIDIIKVTDRYNYKTGFIDTIYCIDDKVFINSKISELFNAGYMAEDEKGHSYYLGAELKGHIFQKYLPGQFFVFDGKYYEMMYLTGDNHVLVRRAADHIFGRPAYRQFRNYTLVNAVDSDRMGAQRDIAGIRIFNMNADITVKTPSYLKMNTYKDFETAKVVTLNGIPDRSYMSKQMLRIELPGADSGIVYTIANLMNEVFRTLFAENQAFICAVTAAKPDNYDEPDKIRPLTYSVDGEIEENSIYIIEDSQLDLGLLVSVERNLQRIFEIVTDYLQWNEEAIELSKNPPVEDTTEIKLLVEHNEEEEKPKKKGFLAKIKDFFGRIFNRKKKDKAQRKRDKEEKKKAKEQAKADKKKAKEERKRVKKAGAGAAETPDANGTGMPVPMPEDAQPDVQPAENENVVSEEIAEENMNAEAQENTAEAAEEAQADEESADETFTDADDAEESQLAEENTDAEIAEETEAEEAEVYAEEVEDVVSEESEAADETESNEMPEYEAAEEVEEIADTEAAEENTDSETDDDEDADVMISDENMNNSEGSTEMFFSFRPLMRYYQNNDGSNAASEDSEAEETQTEAAEEAVTDEIIADEAVQETEEETAEEAVSEEEIQDEAEDVVSDEESQETSGEDAAQDASEEADDCIDYHKKQLCDSYKELYDRLLECLNNGIFSVNDGLSEYVADDIFNVLKFIERDHPELVWMTPEATVYSNSETGEAVSVELAFGTGLNCEPEMIAELQAKAENAAAELVEQASALEGDYEKALFVHEELVKRLSYDHELAAAIDEPTPEVKLNATMYGAFVNNKTICKGYAQAYQYVMKKLGIECAYVSGKAEDTLHAWNLVKLDGEYYYVDVTWDDPTFKNGEESIKSHYYCFAPTSWMNKTHTPGDEVFYPECAVMDNNYYVRSGLFMDAYSYDNAKACIKNALDAGIVIELAFSSVVEYDNALDILVQQDDFRKIMAELGHETGKYSYIEKSPVIIFDLNGGKSDGQEENADGDNKDGDDENKPVRMREIPPPVFSRGLYHERYYLLYGAKEEKTVLRKKETLDYLLGLGFGNNSLHQARKGADIAALIEKTFDPSKPGAKFCDFCGTELVGTEYELLSDGRERCTQCSRTAVRKAEDFVKIYQEVARNLESFFGIKFNASFKIEMVTTQQLAKRTGRRYQPTNGFDARAIGVAIKDESGYTLLIEGGTPKVSAMLTIAHELTHIWQYLNWDDNKIIENYGADLRLEVYEGMAKWVEIQYALLINEVAVATREKILTLHRDDEYGRGFVRYAQQYPFSKGSYVTKPTPFLFGNNPL
ncbi:MAG: hypothetical protein IKV76_09940 [Clostridia bacterium]|nr:hypothetical protein [Clostridia bacterium]